MVSVLRQTKSRLNADYVVEHNGEITYTASVPFSGPVGHIELYHRGAEYLHIDGHFAGAMRQQHDHGMWNERPFKITDIVGRDMGRIISRRSGFFFARERYVDMTLLRANYKVYEVGLGKEGLKFPIFDGEQQVALIEKAPVITDNLDEYDIYAIDGAGELAAIVFGLWYDYNFCRNREYVTSKKEIKFQYTLNERIKAKYDPAFKELCR